MTDTTLFDQVTPDPQPDPNAPPPDPNPAPPQQPLAQEPPAWATSLADRFASMLGDRIRPQDPATSAQAPQPMSRTWYETLNEAQRKTLKEQSILDQDGTQAFIAQQEAEHAERRIIAQSQPIVASQGATFVEMFKTRKSRGEKYFDQIEPLFDRSLAGIDLRPLVNMSQAQRDSELDLRWKAAKSEVTDKILATPPKPQPNLTVTTGPAVTEPPSFSNDDWLQAMDAGYKFTPEQKAALEAAAKAGD